MAETKLASAFVEVAAKGIAKVLTNLNGIKTKLVETAASTKPFDAATERIGAAAKRAGEGFATLGTTVAKAGQLSERAFVGGVAAIGGFVKMADPRGFENFQVALAKVGVQLGRIFVPLLDDATAALERLAAWLKGLTDAQREQILHWVKMGLAVAAGGTLLNRLLPIVGSVTGLLSGLSGGLLQVGSGLVGVLGPALGSTSSLFTGFGQLAGSAFGTLFSAVSGLGGVVGGLGTVLGSGGAAAIGFIGKVAGLGGSLLGLLGPVGLAAGAIAYLLSLFGLGDKVGGAMGGAINDLAGAFAPIIETVKSVFGQLLPIVTGLVEKVVPILTGLLVPVLGLINSLAQAVGSVVVPIAEALADVLPQVLSALTPVITAIVEVTQTLLTALGPVLKTMAEVVGGVVKVVAGVFAALMAVLKPIINLLSGVLKTAIEILAEVFKAVGEAFKFIVNGIIDMINSVLRKINEWTPITVDLIERIGEKKDTKDTDFHSAGQGSFGGGTLDKDGDRFRGQVREKGSELVGLAEQWRKAMQAGQGDTPAERIARYALDENKRTARNTDRMVEIMERQPGQPGPAQFGR